MEEIIKTVGEKGGRETQGECTGKNGFWYAYSPLTRINIFLDVSKLTDREAASRLSRQEELELGSNTGPVYGPWLTEYVQP